MTESKRSKKQLAIEYFTSLDDSTPLRDRVDSLVEYMKMEFVNGQTERVVFNYIRDIIPSSDMPSSDDEIFHKILAQKFLEETKFDRGYYNSADENDEPTRWDLMTSREKILKILPLMNLYTTEVYAANSFAFSRRNGKLYFGKYTADQEVSDNGWLSRFSDGADALKNHFPFLSRWQLEEPMSDDAMVEISKTVLSDAEAEEVRGLLTKHGSSGLAFKALKESGNSRSRSPSAERQKNTGRNGGLGGAILVVILLAFVSYIFLKPSTSPSENSSEPAIASDYEGTSEYRSESDSSYSGPSSSIRESMNSEQREKYDNMSSEGKAYVDDQMRQYDEYCAGSSDC
ncbi:MAG: hypothetical protein RSE14_10450 [Erythrobacter sp.]|uniref:hypothetical protein n=1 Tax=Erythrobacter sp. TaxID=1042 RepID=UPI002B48B7D1|nr:hypothetical protein [Erythrobacter sp.]WRH69697.1 MAG: hypothetical protein RSE14_10450 [Erythrobacter sp.]